MSKTWIISKNIFFVVATSLLTVFAAAVVGVTVVNDYPSPPSDLAMSESLFWAILTCVACIALSLILFVKKGHNISLGEMLILVFWPILFVFDTDRNPFVVFLPQEVIVPLFLVLIVVTFGRIRYHVRKVKEVPTQAQAVTPAH